MAVPKYDEMYNDFLEILKDEKIHEIREIRDTVAKKLKLTDEELGKVLNSGKNLFYNRIGWTGTYLKKAGLIYSPKRGSFVITKEGKKAYESNKKITNEYLLQYDEFTDFISPENIAALENNEKELDEVQIDLTPQERIEKSIQEINNELEENLLEEIKKEPFTFLEKLAVQLMVKMGYGNKENATITKATRDGGVDGIIFEDELGISKILIQAKLYARGEKVSRPDMQKFKGAMDDNQVEKGVFFTTSDFTEGAIKRERKKNVIIINGKKLVELMIKYNVGCYTDNTYEIKKIDLDFFENE